MFNKDFVLAPSDRSNFWKRLEELYDIHRGQGRNTPKTLISNINYADKLTAQIGVHTNRRCMVLYPSSGDNMRAVRVKGGSGFVDSSLFWFLVESEDEAGYLVSLLNAKCLRDAFYSSKESGRHFQLHPWRKVPIPRYDENNGEHFRLAKLCGLAEEIADSTVREAKVINPGLGQIGLSKRIRDALFSSPVGDEIDDLARSILPAQVKA